MELKKATLEAVDAAFVSPSLQNLKGQFEHLISGFDIEDIKDTPEYIKSTMWMADETESKTKELFNKYLPEFLEKSGITEAKFKTACDVMAAQQIMLGVWDKVVPEVMEHIDQRAELVTMDATKVKPN